MRVALGSEEAEFEMSMVVGLGDELSGRYYQSIS